MRKMFNLISCTFAAVASIFFVGDIAVLSGGKGYTNGMV